MSRIVRRSAVFAAGLAGLVVAFGPAQASMPNGYSSACVGSAGASYGRLACRPVRTARRRARTYRPMIADARLYPIDPDPYGVGRYVSLLILGVGF